MNAFKKPRHYVFSTPFGPMVLIYRENPFVLTRTLLPKPDIKEVLKKADTDPGKYGENPDVITVSEIIAGYFNGNPSPAPWKWLYLEQMTPLSRAVLKEVAGIGFGETRTYKQIAEAVNRPRAWRFVGSTMAKNPFPVLIPCHRVIKSDQTIGQFGGGIGLKRKMLDMEKHFLKIPESF